MRVPDHPLIATNLTDEVNALALFTGVLNEPDEVVGPRILKYCRRKIRETELNIPESELHLWMIGKPTHDNAYFAEWVRLEDDKYRILVIRQPSLEDQNEGGLNWLVQDDNYSMGGVIIPHLLTFSQQLHALGFLESMIIQYSAGVDFVEALFRLGKHNYIRCI